MFSVISQSPSSSSFVLDWGSRRFARMEGGCIEKASGGNFARTTRNANEDGWEMSCTVPHHCRRDQRRRHPLPEIYL